MFKPAIPTLQKGTFHIAHWGCQMNVYDAMRLSDLMVSHGYVESSPENASVIILITCAVRAKAEDKVFNQILSWQHAGIVRDDTLIALGGCVGAELGQALIKENPRLNIVFSPRTAHRLPALIEKFKATGRNLVDVEAQGLEKFDFLPLESAPALSSFVTIMEGCSNKCTYCIVPYTRGPEISRPVKDILTEARHCLEHGAREIHLLGQNVNSFCGEDTDGTTASFASLLYEVAALPGIERLRFTTSNPMDFTDDIVTAIRDLEVIADHVHVPIQSGSNRILEFMHRRYTRDAYLRLTDRLYAARDGISLSSDFIVGFPGENEQDFEDTLDIVRRVHFDQSFSFIYSKRPGTPAAALPDETPLEVKKERLYRLQELLDTSARECTEALVGSVQHCLVEGISRKDAGELKARASNNHVVVFEGSPDLIGTMVKVRITESIAHTLRGEAVYEG